MGADTLTSLSIRPFQLSCFWLAAGVNGFNAEHYCVP